MIEKMKMYLRGERRMEKRWETKQISMRDAHYLSKITGVPLSIAKLLVSVGIVHPKEAMEFLKPDFRTLHNPFLMKDMEKAVQRILQAIEKKERILAYGDYDADGVTTITMFKEGFNLLGVDIDVYAPNRFVDGYGLNPKKMEQFAKDYDLILSGDTGIKAFAAGELLATMDAAELIITDHHEPLEGDLYVEIMDNLTRKEQELAQGVESDEATQLIKETLAKYPFVQTGFDVTAYSTDELITMLYDLAIVPKESVIEIYGRHYIALPKAYAVVNPKRLHDKYPCKSLSGVAVVFKLFQALFIEKNLDLKPLLSMLDVVAVGLVADLVQQIDRKTTDLGTFNDFEVRVMTAYGLKLMNKAPKPWVKAIAEVTNIKLDEGEVIESSHIGFRFGPMLNAPGRLTDPTVAVNLLLEKDHQKAKLLADDLKQINTERQEQIAEYKTVSAELRQLGPAYYDYGIVVQSESFHIGIAGLVAGRLCEEYYRPSVALAPIEQNGRIVLKGSARSIPGINVEKILGEVQKDIGHFEYGGHPAAAGMTILPEQFEGFRTAFRKYCQQHDPSVFVPLFKYDAEVTLDEILEQSTMHDDVSQYPFMKFLSMLEPFGQENREPIFRANNLEILSFDPIMEGKGYRLTFKTNCGKISGIAFKGGETILPLYEENLLQKSVCKVDALFTVGINVWQGKKSLQLMIQDMKFI